MNKQQKTAVNMAKFIQDQSLLLLDRLNELDLDHEADFCEKLHEDAGNDSNLLIVFYVQIMPDDFVMQLHRF